MGAEKQLIITRRDFLEMTGIVVGRILLEGVLLLGGVEAQEPGGYVSRIHTVQIDEVPAGVRGLRDKYAPGAPLDDFIFAEGFTGVDGEARQLVAGEKISVTDFPGW